MDKDCLQGKFWNRTSDPKPLRSGVETIAVVQADRDEWKQLPPRLKYPFTPRVT